MAEIRGQIIAVLPLASGVSNRTGKEWASQEYVIEEKDTRYPQRVCFRVFGSEKIQQYNLQLNDVVTVKLELACREYNGKWYNEINCWDVERPQMMQPQMPIQQVQQPQQQYVQDVPQQQPQQVQQIPQPQQPMPQQPQNYAPAGAWQQPAPQYQPQSGYQQSAIQQQGYEDVPF